MTYGKIDISLTSMSGRMDSICATLKSLLAQDYRDLQVHLYLSREPYLLDEGIPEIPQHLHELQKREDDRLRIHYCTNTGPYRKLLPFLYENWGRSKLVVTADDDTIYPPNWLSRLVAAYDVYGCSIAFRGHWLRILNGKITPYRSWMKAKIEENPSLFILPTGKDGILYNTAFFPVNVLNVDDAIRIAPTADDLWFRWHLSLNKIKTHLISTEYATNTFEEADYDHSLYLNFNQGGGNDRSIAGLESYFKDRFGAPNTATAWRGVV